jgi:hypothetical protein
VVVDEARHHRLAAQVDALRIRSRQTVMSALLPTAMMREPRTATACAIWKVSLTVMIFPLNRMRSAPGCCACSDSDSPTTPPHSSSHANFFITSSRRPGTRF